MFTIQSLIAVAVTIGVAVVWTMAITAAGVLWQRREMREFLASHASTVPVQDVAPADDARDLALR
jgi:hypothetical protein